MASEYETDFAAWADDQARALRAHQSGGNVAVDWAHLIEEVEGLGASDRRELRNRLRVLIEHLFKLANSAAQEPRAGWRETVRAQRGQLDTLLAENRSMRASLGTVIAEVTPRARGDAAAALRDRGETVVIEDAAVLTEEQLLGDWLP